jgi:hypothetical protein
MKASLPYWNPYCKTPVTNHEKVPAVTGHTVDGHTVTATFKENGARVVRADLIYAISAPGKRGQASQEWFRAFAEIENGQLKGTLPPEATHTYINLIDENNFWVNYPQASGSKTKGRGGEAESDGGGENNQDDQSGAAIPLGAAAKHSS